MNINVDDLVLAVRQRVREQAQRVASKPVTESVGSTPIPSTLSTSGIQSALSYFQSEAAKLGMPTPEPPTFRGRAGAAVIRLLSRALWWYTHELGVIFSSLANLLREQLDVLTSLKDGLDLDRRQESAALAELRQWARHEIDMAVNAERAAHRQTLDRATAKVNRLEERLAYLEGKVHAVDDLKQLPLQLDVLQEQIDVAKEKARVMALDASELGVLIHRHRAATSLQDRRISLFMEEARKRIQAPLNADQINRLSELDQHKYDSLYVDFEDVFRGARTEIEARQSAYLPLLREHQVGTESRPLLDLGCGRGEWLHLLQQNQIISRGVDRNDRMIELCREADLDVNKGDALDYLRSLPDEVLGAVSSFHMVEHLPFDRVIAIIDECLRVLRPGGILLLETPNPQNLQVGAHTFYYDPTHLRPLPSGMLRFFVEARGFCQLEIRELHPYASSICLPATDEVVSARLNQLLYGPQDYAVIGVKP